MTYLLFSVVTRPNVNLLVRENPMRFLNFTDISPEQVQRECQFLAQQATSSLHLKFNCTICKTNFDSKLAATNHAMSHERAQTRQNNRVCLSQTIKDTYFFLFTCAKCPANFTNKTTLLMHMQMHVDKKIYQCRLCP